jgi:cysteate synthase
MSHYTLACSVCGRHQIDDGKILDCPENHSPGLLVTDYSTKEFAPGNDPGIYRYHQWLPIRRTFSGACRSTVYRSERLGSFLGLRQLWIAYNGYWPERGAEFETGTFKELEAYTVLSRLPERAGRVVVASAGNTAAAFAVLCSRYRIRALLIVPACALKNIKMRQPLHPCVKIIAIEQADYYDAISLGDFISSLPGFLPEGGTKNVGRRDGLGTVLLSAVESLGSLPDYYFQAIGSGAGAIAVHEAARRVRTGSVIAGAPPKLMLAQNSPFTPVHRAWRSRQRAWTTGAADRDRLEIDQVCAPELTNRMPPYVLRGGLYDVLTESSGEVFTIDNTEARDAMRAFFELEGIDIEPAAGVTVAALHRAVVEGRVDTNAKVLLNITGGGRARLAQEYELTQITPSLTIHRSKLDSADGLSQIIEMIPKLCDQDSLDPLQIFGDPHKVAIGNQV